MNSTQRNRRHQQKLNYLQKNMQLKVMIQVKIQATIVKLSPQ